MPLCYFISSKCVSSNGRIIGVFGQTSRLQPDELEPIGRTPAPHDITDICLAPMRRVITCHQIIVAHVVQG